MKSNTANSILLNVTEVLLLASRVAGAALFGVLIVSLAYETVLRPRHAFNVQYMRFMKPDVHPRVISIADSRGVYALHHGSIDRSFFNYSHFGEFPHAQFLRARHVIRDKPSVQVLVMQMDPYVVEKQRAYRPLPSSRAFYEALLYSSLTDIKALVAPTRDDLTKNIIGFAFPLSISWERMDFWGAVRQSLTTFGFLNDPKPERYFNICGDLFTREQPMSDLSPTERVKSSREQATSRYRDNSFDPDLARKYTDFIAYTSSKGIRVIGIRFPDTMEYREIAERIGDPRAEKFMGSLGVPILDYRNFFDAFPNRDGYFVDAEHLTGAGANLLSARLAQDVRRIVDLPQVEPWACRSLEPIEVTSWPFELPLRRLLGGLN